ncbi:MAG: stage V sporulation protein AB [Eubacteriales bacterium]|nr:stage V sporulation protein AB [Eubacteriales bacterium]
MILEILFGFGAGAVTASGFFALLSFVQLINRFAAVTDSRKYLNLYENMIIGGAIAGNIIFIFNISFPLKSVIMLPGIVLYGLAAGMFIGTFSVCLAETIKALPIFVRRIRIGAGLGWLILSIALGKCVGHLVYYLMLYK